MPTTSTEAKIDPELLEKFESVSKVNIFIEANGSIEDTIKDINETTYPDRDERITAMVKALVEFAGKAQKTIKEFLTERYFPSVF
jgi:hypothetical protein